MVRFCWPPVAVAQLARFKSPSWASIRIRCGRRDDWCCQNNIHTIQKGLCRNCYRYDDWLRNSLMIRKWLFYLCVHLLQGDFQWMNRSRIRLTLFGQNGNMPVPLDMLECDRAKMELNECPTEFLSNEDKQRFSANMRRTLPYLALNEVDSIRSQLLYWSDNTTFYYHP